MDHDDERIEVLLRQFRPRAPRPLPAMAARQRYLAWVGVAAAAAAAVMAANLRFMPMAERTPVVIGPALTLNDMRALVDADAATLDRALLDASRHALPDVEAPDTLLGRLAQP